jgi:hypothetical protein
VRDPATLVRARDFGAALRRLTERVEALRAALAGSRAAFAGARASALESDQQTHAALAEAVHAGEREVVAARRTLQAGLGLAPDARMAELLRHVPAAAAGELAAAASALRRGLLALRVETAVGERLLELTQRAQAGWRGRPGPAARRYDRHARTLPPGGSGDLVQGTI